MVWLFDRFSKRGGLQLGIDIGTSFIRAVVLERASGPAKIQGEKTEKPRFILKNYGHIASQVLYKKDGVEFGDRLEIWDSKVVALIKELLQAMGKPATDRAVLALPVFASFLTEISLPQVSEKELSSAIKFQAESYIPIPISEVEVDWEIIKSGPKETKVLLVAVPKTVIARYEKIARQAGLDLKALEVETFTMIRSLAPEEPLWALVDIGRQNTAIAVVEDGFIRLSRNLDASGSDLTKAIAQSLGVSESRAEAIKKREGLLATGGEARILQTMEPVLDKMVDELDRVLSTYLRRNGKKVQRVILTGGSSRLKGIESFFQDKLRIPVTPADPWKNVEYPEALRPALKELASSYSVALGLAMR
jgi:type IV pilus assembly protein PilM